VGSSLGVRRGSDAEAETGGERLVRPGTAAVQLPATATQ
uniref:Par-3 family cell polarity regulator alpha, a n=1 Tax=Labrus bergylta TaxID=56723 RepID=A0A3Q3E3N2_9LABR